MKNTLETRLGIFFAVALVAAVLVIETIGSLNIFRTSFTARARFERVQELKEGDSVKMAGVRIGRVEKLRLTPHGAEVVMDLDNHELIKTDSVAKIGFAGLLGQNYVSISFGSEDAPPLERNGLMQTVEQASLETIVTQLDGVASGVENLTRSFSGENFSNLLGPVTDFLRENSPRLGAMIENMRSISQQIADGEGTVGKLIYEEALYENALAAVTNLNETASKIEATLAQAQVMVDDVQNGRGTLGKLVTDEKLYNETAVAMGNLREIMEKINRGQGSVGMLVNDESLFTNAKMALQKVEKATEGLEDQGPMSVMGVLVNGLF